MPYKDKAARAAYQKRLRERRRSQGLEPQKQYRKPRHEWDPMRDLRPENARRCCWRFHTSNPCRRKANWISPTATKWCDVHAEGRAGLRRIEE